jgi:uncharacterized protein (DUF362 family)
MPHSHLTRREFLRGSAAAAGWTVLGGAHAVAAGARAQPSAPVAIARCPDYSDPARVRARLATLIDQIGGIRRLVRGKMVAVKLNLVGETGGTFQGARSERSYQVHPSVALALADLLQGAGARRIRFLESGFSPSPFYEALPKAGWDMDAFRALGVTWEDTRNLGQGKRYSRLKVPGGGYIFPAYDVNHAYEETDVYVSLAKLKNHATAGVTLALKNSFGVPPSSLYGDDAGSETAVAARVAILHDGRRKPPAGIPAEIDPGSPRVPSWRVPHVIADLAGCRLIDLAIIDGVESVKGGEGPWIPTLERIKPGLLLAGRNAVCTDAVAMAAMGYDPQAPAGTRPFPGENHLALAAAKGLGTNDLKRIEVRGLSIAEARHPYGHFLGR